MDFLNKQNVRKNLYYTTSFEVRSVISYLNAKISVEVEFIEKSEWCIVMWFIIRKCMVGFENVMKGAEQMCKVKKKAVASLPMTSSS